MGSKQLKDGAAFNGREEDEGRADQKFSSGHPEFEIRLSGGVEIGSLIGNYKGQEEGPGWRYKCGSYQHRGPFGGS